MIKYLQPVNPRSAEGLVEIIYSQVERDFGKIVEPFQLHSPLPRLLAGTWMVCRETELVGSVPREIKEAVAAIISTLNNCPYCIDAHTIMLEATGEHTIAGLIGRRRYKEISADRVRNIAEWATTTGTHKRVAQSSLPFSAQEAPEIIGTAVFYHYINRMATIFLGKTPLPSNVTWLKNPLKRIAGRMFSPAVHRPKTAGESLKFLPPATLPEDLQWARSNPIIAQAFARFADVINLVGEQALPQQVRENVLDFICKWQGETFGSCQSGVRDETKDLDEASRIAFQVTVLTAISPSQVKKDSILKFRRYFPTDESLLGALAWGSFAAARKIGTWV